MWLISFKFSHNFKMIQKTKKALKRTHKRAKKKAKFLLRHPFLLPVTTFFVVVFFGMGMFVTVGATDGGAKDTKIVNLYVDGEQQTLTTRAKTVGDLLNRLEIKTIEEDIIEPAIDEVILENNTQINVYRARPVEIIDEGRTITFLSAQRAPRLVASEAGITLFPEDDAYFGRRDESLLESSASEQLIIDRSTEVQLNIYGVLTKIRTTADTVQEVLNIEGVTVQEGDSVQPTDLSALIKPGLLISVNRQGINTIAITEPVPYETETRTDPNLEVGVSQIATAGINGEKAVIYEITEQDGVEISRREIQTIITINPVNEVRVRGTKLATLSASVNVSADKASLMAAAGIAESDYVYVDYIISKESGWRPGALNSGSGAYGLCQSLPASKMASAGADYLTNPVTQLRWCAGYSARYGGWQGAYNAWLVQGWW
jgi:uncharacterized protein YabE (DUF348 family)